MSGTASAAAEVIPMDRPPTRRRLLRLLTGILAGGAVLLLCEAAAGASANTPPAPGPTTGLVSGLVGDGGALAPVVDLVDGAAAGRIAPAPSTGHGASTSPSHPGPLAATVGDVAAAVDTTLAPVTTPIAPVTDPITAPVVDTVATVVATTVGALPPTVVPTPVVPVPVVVPGLPEGPRSPLPGIGSGARPVAPAETGTATGRSRTSGPAATILASASTAPGVQPPAASLHGWRSLIARGSAADGAAARTRGDHLLRTQPTSSARAPAPVPGDSRTAPAPAPLSSSACSGPSGSGTGALLLFALHPNGARRSHPTSTVSPSSTPRHVRGPSDDPGFAPD